MKEFEKGCLSTGWTPYDFLNKPMKLVRVHMKSCHKKFGVCRADTHLKIKVATWGEFGEYTKVVSREWVE